MWSECVRVCVCVCTQLLAAALSYAVAVHLAEVSGVEADAGRMQQHAVQTSQTALWWHAEVTRRMALQDDTYEEKHQTTHRGQNRQPHTHPEPVPGLLCAC